MRRPASRALVLLVSAACSPPAKQTGELATLPLLERFEPELVESVAAPRPQPAASGWRFADADATWRPVQGVEATGIEQGRLTGRTTSAMPVIELGSPQPMGEGDSLHAIEVRARVSAGATLSAVALGTETEPAEELLEERSPRPWAVRTPLLTGEGMQTYTLRVAHFFTQPDPAATEDIDRVLLTPSNAPGAEFAIEEVRLVFRREHLAALPSGPGWHGLGEVYRDTLVSRAPERVRFPVELPPRPWLDLAVGTVEELPVAFRVEVAEPGAAEGVTVIDRLVTRPERWEPASAALDPWAGRVVDLLLSAEAETPGAIAFWGTAVVRERIEEAEPDLEPQGVVMFLADTLRPDHLPFHGYDRDTAPHLSRLAEEGAVFLDAHAQATWTKVSVPSIVSSTYPSSHGIVEFQDRLPATAVTLAEALRAAGFATFATSSVAFTGQQSHLQQGFEVLHEVGSYTPPEGTSKSKTARVFTDRTLDWIGRHREVPFFALLHCLDPHAPYRPYAPYDQLWTDPDRLKSFEEEIERVEPYITAPVMRRFGMATREQLEAAGIDPEAHVAHALALYDGSIRALDAEVGRIMARLREWGLAERTLFVFLSDHGEEFLDHGRPWHGNNVYTESTAIPLVFWGSGVPEGVEVTTPVASIDVMPTVVELAGLPLPDTVQGRSLVPLLRPDSDDPARGEAAWQDRPVFAERVARSGRGPEELDSRAVITKDWKLVRNLDPPDGVPVHELYDRRRDPYDQNDVANLHPDVVERLAARLDRWEEWVEDRRLPSDEEAASTLDAQELERLRSLGYLE